MNALKSCVTRLAITLIVLATVPSILPSPTSGQVSVLAFASIRNDSLVDSGRRTPRELSRQDRMNYQLAIEEVYWRHRIWPQANAGPKPALAEVMMPSQVAAKVDDYLRRSNLLESYRHGPLTTQELRAEVKRMALDSQRPDMLKELFAALENDPRVIAECLARPLLVDRLLTASPEAPTRRNVAISNRLAAVAISARASDDPMAPAHSALQASAPGFWSPTSLVNAPSKRYAATGVWTGSEMIVWGGYSGKVFTNTGGRYDPATDSWSATNAIAAPIARRYHTAVWTGSEMIIWGGSSRQTQWLGDGGRYNPATDSWAPINGMAAPAARYAHAAVWSGSEMIVWGGNNGSLTNTGGRYDPGSDNWTPMATPSNIEGRRYHTAVWTGSEMIIWGGEGVQNLNTGGRYNPATDSWSATSVTRAPSGRNAHTAIWTGTEMIVWGGINATYPYYLNTGGRYDPATNRWTRIGATNAPEARSRHAAVWTGSEMVIWGGVSLSGALNTGGVYDPFSSSWAVTSMANAPAGRYYHAMVWTGDEMIIWGGGSDTGGRYRVR